MEGKVAMKIPRWVSGLFVGVYISLLSWGIVGHALKMPSIANAFGYFIVWDMFCGWQAYDNRTHIIGEDSQGNYYEIREPWGAFQPFGNVDRVNYDVSNYLAVRHIRNVLKHSDHPPLDRVYVVQEIWAKQYNVPDHLWNCCFSEPKDKMSYFNLRAVCTEDGMPIETNPDWFTAQTLNTIADNPRLRQQAQSAQPYYNTFFNPRNEGNGAVFSSAQNNGLSTN
jgi:hypothetical protein